MISTTTTTNNRALIFDLKVESADSQIRRNLLSIRSGVTQANGYIDQQAFTVPAGGTVNIPDLPMTFRVCVYSQYPLYIQGTVTGASTQSNFPGQMLFILDTGVTGLTLTNTGTTDSPVFMTRLSTIAPINSYVIPPTLLTFPAYSDLVPIGAAVTNLSKVVVTDIAYNPLVNDQVDAPSLTIGQAFRICDSSGNANITGSYLMYLNQAVTGMNTSGLLQLWIYQTS